MNWRGDDAGSRQNSAVAQHSTACRKRQNRSIHLLHDSVLAEHMLGSRPCLEPDCETGDENKLAEYHATRGPLQSLFGWRRGLPLARLSLACARPSASPQGCMKAKRGGSISGESIGSLPSSYRHLTNKVDILGWRHCSNKYDDTGNPSTRTYFRQATPLSCTLR